MPHARVGTTLRDKWHLDALLGIGGMAAVYSATHRNGKRGAVKILHPQTSDPMLRRRFLQEGLIANKVEHKAVVSVIDDDVAEDGSPFLVMELLEGESLAQRAAAAGGVLPMDEVLRAMEHVLDALVAAHDKGIVHRDIKPENVFLTRDGRIKLLDFGIAHIDDPEASGPRATQAGTPMGTPAFMAPEQASARWEHVGPQSDLWSVGATMFTLLTGTFVHEAESLPELLAFVITRPVRSLAELLPEAPSAVVTLVDRALERSLAERWLDAREMLMALRAARAQLARPRRDARTLHRVLTGVLCACGAVAIVWSAFASQAPREARGIHEVVQGTASRRVAAEPPPAAPIVAVPPTIAAAPERPIPVSVAPIAPQTTPPGVRPFAMTIASHAPVAPPPRSSAEPLQKRLFDRRY